MADQSKPFFSASSSARKLSSSRKFRSLTPESKFWRSFKNSELSSGLILPVTSLDFSPSPPFDLAFACSTAVHIFDGASLSPKAHSPISSFADIAYSPSFRCDGALLAAGCDSGIVQIFNPLSSGHAIRLLRSHSRPVRAVRFPRAMDKLHLFSAGDDAVFSYWDVSAESPLLSFPSAHRDYIRACSPSPISADVVATGSYDHTAKLWDVRMPHQASSSFAHGDPVECVLFLPSGGLIATAGGSSVKIWDVIGGGRLLHAMESHNKTVTSLCLGRAGTDSSRVLSVSIDGYLKVFDYAEFRVTHTVRHPAQLLSVGFSPSGLSRVVGASNGVVYVGKKKKKAKEEDLLEVEKKVLRPSYYRYFHRGQSEKPSEADHVIKKPKRVKLAEHDKLLKKFRHGDALLFALNTKITNSIVAILGELVARKKLVRCIENLDANGFGLMLGFLYRNTTKPRYGRFLTSLANRVLEMRSEDVQSSKDLRCLALNLKCMIEDELKIHHALWEIQGMLSPLLAIAGK